MHDGAGSPVDHPGDDRAVQSNRGEEIRVECELPVVVRERGRAAVVLSGSAYVVYRDVDLPETPKRLIGQCGDAVGGGDIGEHHVIGVHIVGDRSRRHQHPRAACA